EGIGGQKRFVTIKHLRFDNDGLDHMVLAKATINQDTPTEVSFVIHGVGDIKQREQMKVKAYVYFNALSLSQWVGQQAWQGWHVNDGVASAKVWLDWDQNTLQMVQSVFQVYNLKISSDKSKTSHDIDRISADFGWK